MDLAIRARGRALARARRAALRPARDRRRHHRRRRSPRTRPAHGLAVALVDAGDFGGATSSASSKLIHGGLRYLAPRRRAARPRGAPRAAHADAGSSRRTSSAGSRSCFPLYRGRPVPAVRRPERDPALLDARARAPQLARRSPSARARIVPAAAHRRPALVRALRRRLDERRAALPRERRGGGGGRARSCSTTPRSSRCGRRREVCGAEVAGRRRGRRRRARASSSTPPGRGSTTSAGSRIRGAGTSVRLSKGVHVLVAGGERLDGGAHGPARRGARHVRRAVGGHAAARHDRHRVRRRPGDVAVDEADVEQVLDEASRLCRRRSLGRDDVRASFAGLRVLPLRRGRDRERPARDGLLDRAGAGCSASPAAS